VSIRVHSRFDIVLFGAGYAGLGDRAVRKQACSGGGDYDIENIQLKSNRPGQQGGDGAQTEKHNAKNPHLHSLGGPSHK